MKFDKIVRLSNKFFRAATLVKYAKKSSAGFAFVCLDDNTIFLTKRAQGMNSSGTWDISGGRYDDGDSDALDTANREAHEELTTLPANRTLIARHELPRNKDHTKKYVIFLYSIPQKSKDTWEPKLDEEENSEFKWFDLDKLPKNTHLDLSWLGDVLENKKAPTD